MQICLNSGMNPYEWPGPGFEPGLGAPQAPVLPLHQPGHNLNFVNEVLWKFQ